MIEKEIEQMTETMTKQKYQISDRAARNQDTPKKYGILDTELNNWVKFPDGRLCYEMKADDALDALLELRGVIF